jgi:hypothetical protein
MHFSIELNTAMSPRNVMRYTTKVWCQGQDVALTNKQKKSGISSSINELDVAMLSEYAWNLSHGA